MSESASRIPARINWASALTAGLIATVAITITMGLFGQNIMKMLGSAMLGEGASRAAQYALGGAIHLMVGLFYGVLFAWLFDAVLVWNRLLKGVVYGLAITAIALATMPVMMALLGGGKAGNPCNPCAIGGDAAAGNPCGDATSSTHASNPCNPCAASGNEAAAGNPCNPCSGAAQASNPCGSGDPKAGNACSSAAGNPCNPCGAAGAGTYSSLISLINHLVFALVLAFAYRPRAGF